MTDTKNASKVRQGGDALSNSGPNMTYLKEMAKKLGVSNYSKLNKADLIHNIQIAEGYTPCYGSVTVCTQNQCLFRKACLT
ncbi:MAG: Rho termination factor N-terminal domain-containing protein [Desulfarculales bacterium]|jgi:hypothetical protein|nr:Rho termination factor N-terminal domain-containing protein [Desulfarculales bacterium]